MGDILRNTKNVLHQNLRYECEKACSIRSGVTSRYYAILLVDFTPLRPARLQSKLNAASSSQMLLHYRDFLD